MIVSERYFHIFLLIYHNCSKYNIVPIYVYINIYIYIYIYIYLCIYIYMHIS